MIGYVLRFLGFHENVAKAGDLAWASFDVAATKVVEYAVLAAIFSASVALNAAYVFGRLLDGANTGLYEWTGYALKDIFVLLFTFYMAVRALTKVQRFMSGALFLYYSYTSGAKPAPLVFKELSTAGPAIVKESAYKEGVLGVQCSAEGVPPPAVFEVYRSVVKPEANLSLIFGSTEPNLVFCGHGYFVENKAETCLHIVNFDDVVYVKTPDQARAIAVKVIRMPDSERYDYVYLEKAGLQAALGLKSYRCCFPKSGPIAVYTRNNSGFEVQFVQPQRCGKGYLSYFLETKTNTHSGDSGLPVIQNGMVVARHHGAHAKNKTNLHMLPLHKLNISSRVSKKVLDVKVETPTTNDADEELRKQEIEEHQREEREREMELQERNVLDYGENRERISRSAAIGDIDYGDAVNKKQRKEFRQQVLSGTDWNDIEENPEEYDEYGRHIILESGEPEEEEESLKGSSAMTETSTPAQTQVGKATRVDGQTESRPSPTSSLVSLAASQKKFSTTETQSLKYVGQRDQLEKVKSQKQSKSSSMTPEDLVALLKKSNVSKTALLKALKSSGHPQGETSLRAASNSTQKEPRKQEQKVTKLLKKKESQRDSGETSEVSTPKEESK